MIANMLMGLLRKVIVSIIILFAAVLPPQAIAEHLAKGGAGQALLLVDNNWVHERLNDPDIVIVDTRSAGEYEKGHVSGAINLPATDTFRSGPGRGVISHREIEILLGGLGISNGLHVVVYGDATYLDAARVFWTLGLYGQTKLSLLNGAYPGWDRSGLPVDTRIPVVKAVNYHAAIQPGKMATRLQTLLAIKNPHIVVIDTREVDEFQGIKSRASRFGHIPSAINIPKNRNLEVRDGVYYFKRESELENLYAGIDGYEKIILYCNSGSEAAIAYLALALLDKKMSVYDGAWREWGNTPSLPIESPAK